MDAAYVGVTYSSNLTYEAIRSHYDTETARRGWAPCGEKRSLDWFRDLGGVTRVYCKNELKAKLEYAGDRANYGWDYGFGVTWEVR
jgi:hypothetical protein